MSTNLVPSGGSSVSNAFAQQGTVDWTALSRSSVNFSVEILARLSKAGVEPITAAMGQAIFCGFNLDPEGQKRFSDALSRLKAFSSYGDIMWFGFGVKHIVRTLSDTEQGLTCVAMCACLSVSYDKFFCSKVLKALADQQRAPNSLMPSLSQWAALVNICSGAVSGSRFPRLVEGHARLTQSYGEGRHCLRGPTSADALAKALSELSKVSSGTVRSVTFIGGVDCGWLAALSQWLLSLTVDIVDADGSVLYSSRTSDDPLYYPQVTIMLQSDQDGQVNTAVLKKSVFVPSGDFFASIISRTRSGQPSGFYSGRSEWQTILHDAFGPSFDLLLHPKVIDNFAALLYYVSSVSNSDGAPCNVEPWGGFSTTRTERQNLYLSFAEKRLPELIPVCHIAKKMISYQEIILNTQANSLAVLERHCSCAECESSNSSIRPPIYKIKTGSIFCLKEAAFAIFEYIWILSWLDIDENIYPSVNGLVLLSNNHGIFINDTQYDTLNDTLNKIKKRGLDNHIVPAIIQLFTGQIQVDRYSDKTVSARSEGGVCVYLPSLENPTSSPQKQLRAIVVAGHIEWDSKIFSGVIDGAYKGFRCLSDVLASAVAQAYGIYVDLKLVVEETFDSDILIADVCVSRKPSKSSQGVSYHTGHIAHDQFSIEELQGDGPNSRFGASRIRSAILRCTLPSNCYSKSIEIRAHSITGPLPWSGTCTEAAKSLWTNFRNNESYIPMSEEWTLLSQSQCCQEIVRGPYQLLYSIICTIREEAGMKLSSTGCLMCLLGARRTELRDPYFQPRSGLVNYPFCDLQHVTVHSFLTSKPSSRVLLTSAKFHPAPPTSPSSSGPDHTTSDNDQESNRSGLPSQDAFTHTSQAAPLPSGSDDTIPHDDHESNRGDLPSQETFTHISHAPQSMDISESVSPNKEELNLGVSDPAMQNWMPGTTRVFEGSKPRGRLRARSI
ncbi:hypothetical protein V495_02961 [Pseudogymnoascus sp. VKM F-4514 (FW-929)]|nr:hypothetical protein V495_02961 [Pseudogymnoascus sp. VKM F-4514 (FW-929)]KFY54702.1 hypothetical protein V497_07480 [Pseudogymnoascus sp. VKM F-4516 (FW-969)]